MILFTCGSLYHLMSCINIKVQLHPNDEADLILVSEMDYSDILEPLKSQGIFRRVLIRDHSTPNNKFIAMSPEEKLRISAKAERFAQDELGENDVCTHFYTHMDYIYSKLMYYSMVRKGQNPRYIVYEDGMYAYVRQSLDMLRSDGIAHDSRKFSGKRLQDKMEFMCYAPELYVGDIPEDRVRQLPKITPECDVGRICRNIFNVNPVPREKYIFLEESFMKERRTVGYCSDVEIAEQIADIVGKDNIIIKLHPRNEIDRFTPRGFKVMEHVRSPWEVTLMNNDVSDKVFISVSSTASATAEILFNKPMNAVYIYNLIKFGRLQVSGNKLFANFYKKLEELLNRERIQAYSPRFDYELKEILLYLGGKING